MLFSLQNYGWLAERLLLFLWRSPKGATRDFFLKSCQYVSYFVWVWIIWMMRLVDWGSHFRMRDSLGTILIWFIIYYICVQDVPVKFPECVRICGFKINSSSLDRASKFRDSVVLKSWDSFCKNSSFSLLKKLYYIILADLKNGRVSLLAVPGCSPCVFLATATNFCLFLNVAILLKGKTFNSSEDWIAS